MLFTLLPWLPWSLSLGSRGGELRSKQISTFLPIMCYQLSFAKTFTGIFFDVVNPHFF